MKNNIIGGGAAFRISVVLASLMFLPAILAAATFTPSHAKKIVRTINVHAGKSALVYWFRWFDRQSCQQLFFNTDVTEKPLFGSIIVKPGKRTISRKFKKCGGRTTNVLNIYYKSKNQFRGKDRLIIRLKYKKKHEHRFRNNFYVFNLSVK